MNWDNRLEREDLKRKLDQIFLDGQRAFGFEGPDSCPYNQGSWEYESWHKGYRKQFNLFYDNDPI